MTLPTPEDLSDRALALKLAIFDVDGIMTDGSLTFDSAGHELKTFHVRDGLGVKLLQSAGIQVAIITGRSSPIVDLRARELGIVHVIQGASDKLVACERLLAQLSLEFAACAHMGDDLPDLPLLRRCGLAMTVPEAPALVRKSVHWIAPVGGGHGAVRAAAEMLLTARNQWQSAMQPWLA